MIVAGYAVLFLILLWNTHIYYGRYICLANDMINRHKYMQDDVHNFAPYCFSTCLHVRICMYI